MQDKTQQEHSVRVDVSPGSYSSRRGRARPARKWGTEEEGTGWEENIGFRCEGLNFNKIEKNKRNNKRRELDLNL